MDEHMVQCWNSVVRTQDHIYHLGDVAMKKDNLYILNRLNGHKRLVRGNHDIYSTKFYMQWFDEIYGVRVFDNMFLSHIPLHPDSIKPGWINVHGHLHSNKPQGALGAQYYNVSVEMIKYTPVSLEEVRLRSKDLAAKMASMPVVNDRMEQETAGNHRRNILIP